MLKYNFGMNRGIILNNDEETYGSNPKNFSHRFKNISPVRLIVLSFAAVIFCGAGLLTLPISARDGGVTSFIDSFFVATSATCVTGLTPFDTWSHWSAFGQLVIILLIQVGGLGMVTFTTGFTLFLHKKIGLRDMKIVKEYTGASIKDAASLIKTIIYWTLFCELCGAIALGFRFVPKYGLSGVWASSFIAISAYCNAGFDVIGFDVPGNSLIGFASDPVVSVTVTLLITLGGMGFLVVSDIYSVMNRKIKLKGSHQRLNLHTVIVLVTSLILLFGGALMFLMVEHDNTLKDMSLGEGFFASLLESSVLRTAGFNAMPMANLRDVSKVLSILLMFIGASPVSTGGGVKTTTIVVLLVTVFCVLKGENETVLKNHRISKSTVYKSLTVFALAIGVIILASLLIDGVEMGKGFSMLEIIFEVVSAYSTTGTSLGITPELSVFSKILLSLVMFIGRVGIISTIFAMSIKRKSDRKDKIFPEARVIVG